jgi:hypothetical protein
VQVDALVPSGPRKIASKNQVSVPAEYLAAVGVAVGDDLFVVVNPDRPGTLLLLPRSVMADVFKKGWTSIS